MATRHSGSSSRSSAAAKPASAPKAARPAAPPKKDKAVNVRVVMDPSSETMTYYSNHAEIGHNRHEFTMLVSRLPTKPSKDVMQAAKASGEIVLEPEFQILMPPTMIPGLINALVKQKEAYEAEYGSIEEGELNG